MEFLMVVRVAQRPSLRACRSALNTKSQQFILSKTNQFPLLANLIGTWLINDLSTSHLLFRKSRQNPTGNLQPPSPRAKQVAKEDLLEREKFVKLANEACRVREQTASQSSSQSAPAASAKAVPTTFDEDAVLPMPMDVTGIAKSLALVSASTDKPNAPTSQPSGKKDAEMHDGTNFGNQQGQDVTNSESIRNFFLLLNNCHFMTPTILGVL
ncbi:hypothetical protein VP01_2340g1 [Puccinia sorghi]|uniref:Uncharacterized protein n=1 Tax=Puccinia sorghi TaxID=27349 RepID=A0A0L6V7F4_9BASI|nr:hypothetical protein VP01_2340g1 [Puccinia sorghi]